MKKSKLVWGLLALVFFLCLVNDAEGAKRKRRRRSYGPPPTHPVVLWSRTLSESTDREQRKIAAFKLSQYSLQIFQDEVVKTLLKCIKDPDVEIKVLCTKAMGKAGTQSHAETVRKALLEQYQADASVRNTIVRAFISRKDRSAVVHDKLLESLKKSTDGEEQLALLSYFEAYGSGSKDFADSLIGVYQKQNNIKVKTAIISALSLQAEGQDAVVNLLSQCAESHDSIETPLVLHCLSGLQQQAKKDGRAWAAVEKTIHSDDNDVVLASLDVIAALPETPNVNIATRLVKLIEEVEDEDTLEKVVLSLGVCGDHSQVIVDVLQKLLEKQGAEGVRVATALVLGKQADKFPESPTNLLTKCAKEEKSQSLRTACQLGIKEIETRKTMSVQNAPAPSPAQSTTTN